MVARTSGLSRSARDRDGLREFVPAGNGFLDGAAEYRLGRNACDRLSGGIPELNHSLRVDEEDAVGDVAEHPGSLPALLGFLIQPSVLDRDCLRFASSSLLAREEGIALLSQADPFQRMLDALHDRFEQGNFSLVEALVVEACDADHAAADLSGKRHENKLAGPDREQIVPVQPCLLSRQHALPAFVIEQFRALVRR